MICFINGVGMEQRQRLGEIFIEQNIVSRLTMERVLGISKSLNKRFGTVLEEMGLVTGEELVAALALQYSCKTIFNFSEKSYTRQLLDLIPAEVALQNQLFPLKIEKDILALAITDPTNLKVVGNIAKNNALIIIPFITTTKDINSAICRHYFGMDVVKPPNKSVLVVDDDRVNLTMLSEILSKYYSVHTALDGMEAYRVALNKRPSVILADKEISKLNAFGLHDALKNIPETKTIPLILLSCDIDSEWEALSVNKGFFDFVTKPARPQTILARVNRAYAYSVKEPYKK